MPNIPTVSGSDVDYNTPERAAHINAGALQGRQRGALAIAGAVEGIGDEAGGFENQLLRAHDAKIAADVDLRMRKAAATYREQIQNTDEGWRSVNDSKWKDGAQAVADQVREDIFSSHEYIPPMMRSQVESALQSWQGSFLIETQSLANTSNINRAWGKTQQDYDEKLRDADAVGAQHSLDLAASTRIAPPEEIERLGRDIPKTIARNFIQTGLQNNPLGTWDMLKSGASLPATDQTGRRIVPSKVLDPKELQTLLNTAHVRTDTWQAQNQEKMLKGADPVTHVIPEQTIRDAMAAREIDEKWGLNTIKSQDAKVKADTIEKARILKVADTALKGQLIGKIHDNTAWGVNPALYAKDIIGEAAGISDLGMKQSVIDDANHQLEAVRKKGETSDSPVIKDQLEFMKQDFTERTAVVPVFGQYIEGGVKKLEAMPDAELEQTFGKGANRQALIAHANRTVELQRGTYEDNVTKLLDWAKAHPEDAQDRDKAAAARQAIERPTIEARVSRSLNPPRPQTAQDQQALEWATANAKDPRAQRILDLLASHSQ